jgi:DNA polymerase-3 subunit epsilon
VIDVETTGLSAAQHRVLELAVVRTDPWGRVTGEWVRRVDPEGPVGATHVHGITASDVAGAPKFADLIPHLNAWLADTVVVAHNAKFDLAFLRSEYRYAGWALPWLPSLCTLEASDHYLPTLDRRRLVDCCSAAGIPLHRAHSALVDARATAALLGHYLHPHVGMRPRPADLELLSQATTVQWPTAPTSPPSTPKNAATQPHAQKRIQIQAAGAAQRAAAPSLVRLLADFSLVDVMDEGAPGGSLSYLEKLAELLEDGELSTEEAAVLDEVAAAYVLTEEDLRGAHLAFVLALSHLAIDDGTVTRRERDELKAVAALLGLQQTVVTKTLDHAEAARHARLGANLQPLPNDWSHGDPLRVGDKVCFTGCDEQIRLRLEVEADRLGVRVMNNVSRKTALLVTDGGFSGIKAAKAAEIGTRTVHPDQFEVLLQHLQPAFARTTTASSVAFAATV